MTTLFTEVISIYKNYIKRMLDVILSLIGLIVLAPLILIIAILVKINLGSPVVFKQRRPGKGEKIFTLYKFKSMSDKRDENGVLLPDEVRLGRFGKILRSSSCDELLELINIIRGDMSIVGPRPLLVEYLPYYNEFQKRRHEVRPGLTGLAQINGRNATTWDDRFSYDVRYVDSINIYDDFKIIFSTVIKVFKRDGINSENSSTMSSFIIENNTYEKINK